MTNYFPDYMHAAIGFYVYRLLDPRGDSDETFYIGKGWGNRVFAHARREKTLTRYISDIMPLQFGRIHEIRKAGLDVKYIIHRWNLSEPEAFLVESVLIDAYPKLTNALLGHKAVKFGLISPEELAAWHSPDEIEFKESVLLLDVTRTFADRRPQRASIYDAARWAWPLDLNRVKNIKHVLAHRHGCVIEVYEVPPDGWLDASRPRNFPGMDFTKEM